MTEGTAREPTIQGMQTRPIRANMDVAAWPHWAIHVQLRLLMQAEEGEEEAAVNSMNGAAQDRRDSHNCPDQSSTH